MLDYGPGTQFSKNLSGVRAFNDELKRGGLSLINWARNCGRGTQGDRNFHQPTRPDFKTLEIKFIRLIVHVTISNADPKSVVAYRGVVCYYRNFSMV
jgi:hypothetical protein